MLTVPDSAAREDRIDEGRFANGDKAEAAAYGVGAMRRMSGIGLLALCLINSAMLAGDAASLLAGVPLAGRMVLIGILRLGLLGMALAAVVWTRHDNVRAGIMVAVLAGNTVFALVLSVFRDQPETVVMSAVVAVMGGAVVLPWGARWQALLTVLSISTILAGLGAGIVPGSTTLLGVGIAAMCVTPYLAREMARTRSELAEYGRGSVAARSRARAQASRLQAEVASRTAALAAVESDFEQLCRAASHDLRPPLRTIASYSQLLRESETSTDGNPMARQLSRVDEIASSMAERLDDLLREVRASHRTIADSLVSLSDVARTALRSMPVDRGAQRWLVDEDVYAGQPALALAAVLEAAIDWVCGPEAPGRVAELRFRSRVRDGRAVFRLEVSGHGYSDAELLALAEALSGSGSFRGTTAASRTLLAAGRTLAARHGGVVGLERPSPTHLLLWFSPPVAAVGAAREGGGCAE